MHLCSSAGLNDIYNIVCQPFARVDELHVNGADAVGVLVVVDVDDVLRLQLVAIVVDFLLRVVAFVDVEVVFPAAHQLVHLR